MGRDSQSRWSDGATEDDHTWQVEAALAGHHSYMADWTMQARHSRREEDQDPLDDHEEEPQHLSAPMGVARWILQGRQLVEKGHR